MNNFTLLFASALTLASANVDAQTVVKHHRLSLGTPKMKTINTKLRGMIKPQTVREYQYNLDDEKWEEAGLHEYTYDNRGNILTARNTSTDGEMVDLTLNQWNENNQNILTIEQSSEDAGATFVNSAKKVQQFDPVVTDLVVYKMRYGWNDNDWQESGDGFQRTIKRDADNNITSLEVATPYEGKMDAIQRYTNVVDPQTKQVKEYKFEELNYDDASDGFKWSTSEYLINLTWKETNGQLYTQYDEWMQTGNKLLSADLAYDDGGSVATFGSINVEYKDDAKGYVEVAQYTDEPERVVSELTYTDGNGSYVYEVQNYLDTNGDGVYNNDDIQSHAKEIVFYNDNGDCILEQYEELNEDATAMEIVAATKYDYTYDESNGEVKEYIVSDYDYDTQTFIPSMRFATEKFVDVVAGIHNADVSSSDNIQVYNLQGMKVGAKQNVNAKGLYIVKRGGKTIKVVR